MTDFHSYLSVDSEGSKRCSGNGSCGCGRRPKELRVDALSVGEWVYMLGLFLADGCSFKRKGSRRSDGSLGTRDYRIKFSLQGNQGGIAGKLLGMLRRVGLNPFIVTSRDTYEIDVFVYSKSLFMLLPRKELLRDSVEARERFFEENRLFSVERGIPFLAGLIDGDGHCGARDTRKRNGYLGGRGVERWGWKFYQTELPFLVDYAVRFVEPFAAKGATVTKASGRKGRTVDFHQSATVALLEREIAKYSWNAEQWEKLVAGLNKKKGRMAYHSIGEVARMLNTSPNVLRRWIKLGKLKCRRKVGKARNPWFFIASGEVEKFKEFLMDERERLERVKGEGLKFAESSRLLGISYTTVYRWYRSGLLRATMVRGGRPKYLVIPRGEVERLKREFQKAKNVRSATAVLGGPPNGLMNKLQ